MFDIPINFWLGNLHFVILVAAALGFFSAGWLNLDSHRQTPETKMLVRAIGFFVIAFWFLLSASGYLFGEKNWILACIELIGVAILAIGFYIEPLPEIPGSTDHSNKNQVLINLRSWYLSFFQPNPSKGDKAKDQDKKHPSFVMFSLPSLVIYIIKLPIVIWGVLLVRVWAFSTKGLIKDFLGLRNALIFILLSRILSLADIFSGSSNIVIFNLTRQYSYFWIAENTLMLIGVAILLKWIFYYLSFRPAPKLFITFITFSISIFVVSTVLFTGFLYSAQQKNILETLRKNAAVFDFTIKELKMQNELAAYSIAQRQPVIDGATENKADLAASGLGNPIKDLKVGGEAITNRSGEVLATSGSYISAGESLVNDPTIAQALQGKVVSSLVIEHLLDTDQIVARSSYPIVKDAKVYGVAVTDFPIDQAFVDNVKELTKLDVTINIGDVHNATTFVDYNQRRISGTKITNQDVLKLITEGQKSAWAWAGTERVGSLAYSTVYRSLADSDNINIASLMVGQSQKEAIDEISSSIRLTFISISVLILISLLPLYFVAKSISKVQKV